MNAIPNGLNRALVPHVIGAASTFGSSILACLSDYYCPGRDLAETAEAVASVPPVVGRLQPVELPGGAFLLRDEHKSSLETIDAALDLLALIQARRLVVWGDISEPPGSQGPIDRRLGGRIASMADYAVFVDENYRQYARGQTE